MRNGAILLLIVVVIKLSDFVGMFIPNWICGGTS
jgi:Flp pilus assembly protein protease CpaA